MNKPHPDAVPVNLYAVADDGGSGPTQTYAEFQPNFAEAYSVPEGHTFVLQHMGICLDRPATGVRAPDAVAGPQFRRPKSKISTPGPR